MPLLSSTKSTFGVGPSQKSQSSSEGGATLGRDGDVGLPPMRVTRAACRRAKEKAFPFAYLYDETQKIGKQYGANYTPEFIVLNKARKIVYMGAMDDRSPPGEPKVQHLEAAVQAALKGEKPALAETIARGCRVRYVKAR